MTSSIGPNEHLILSDLAKAGFSYNSLSDLRFSGRRYVNAIPVLLNWLKTSDQQVTRLADELIRALSVPWAGSETVETLLNYFVSVDSKSDPTGLGLRWTTGNALDVVFDDAYLPEYSALAIDRRYGPARQMIVLALGKSKRPEAVDTLLRLAEDPDVDGHAIKALSRLRAPTARLAFESKTNDKRAWVRREAHRGLKKLSG